MSGFGKKKNVKTEKIKMSCLPSEIYHNREMVSRAGKKKRRSVVEGYCCGVSLADLAHGFDDGRFCADIRVESQRNNLEVF